jgi:hypothetical protein
VHIVSQNKPGAIHTSGHSPGPAKLGQYLQAYQGTDSPLAHVDADVVNLW